MENLFPELLSYRLLSPLLLRLIASLLLLKITWQIIFVTRYSEKIKKMLNTIPAWNIILWQITTLLLGITISTLLFFGLFTQIAAIILFIISFKLLIVGLITNEYFGEKLSTYLLLIFISLSILFSGAGLWAIDWPI